MATARIGTVDIPDRTEREKYFRELSYLELSALFAGPLKPTVLAKWRETAPKGSLGLVAPWVFTHRQAPTAQRLWRHDPTVGDFRPSAAARDALGPFRAAVDELGAAHVLFRSPPLFAPSAANRDRLRAFFAEVATEEAFGASRVWIPDGLWEPRSAVVFATEIGVTCALDPLVREPGQPLEIYDDLEVTSLYLRISGSGPQRADPGRAPRRFAALVEHYEDVPATIAFESPSRWNDARNLKKLLEGARDESGDDDDESDDDDDGDEPDAADPEN